MSLWHLSRQHLSWSLLSISGVFQLLLTRFWPNFKCRFLGPSWTDSKCQSGVCPGNICPCNICPYQDYISCYWLDFDQTLNVGSWDNLYQIPTVMGTTFVQGTCILATIVHISNISAVTELILTIFLDQSLGALIFTEHNFFWTKLL